MKKERTIILHNNRCSKSRTALQCLVNNRIEHDVRNYLTDSLSKKEIKELLKKMGAKPVDIVRTSEELYKNEFAGKEISDSEWITILEQHPALIQRPIVITEGKAFIAREIETLQEKLT